MANIDELINKLGEIKGDTKPKVENEKMKKGNPLAKGGSSYIPKGVGLGGKRAGSGRKGSAELAKRMGVRDWKLAWNLEPLTYEVENQATGVKEKVTKPRYQWLYEKLYNRAMKDTEITFMKEYLDRLEGKAAQPIRGDGQDDTPISLHVDNLPELLAKVYGHDEC